MRVTRRILLMSFAAGALLALAAIVGWQWLRAEPVTGYAGYALHDGGPVPIPLVAEYAPANVGIRDFSLYRLPAGWRAQTDSNDTNRIDLETGEAFPPSLRKVTLRREDNYFRLCRLPKDEMALKLAISEMENCIRSSFRTGRPNVKAMDILEMFPRYRDFVVACTRLSPGLPASNLEPLDSRRQKEYVLGCLSLTAFGGGGVPHYVRRDGVEAVVGWGGNLKVHEGYTRTKEEYAIPWSRFLVMDPNSERDIYLGLMGSFATEAEADDAVRGIFEIAIILVGCVRPS